MPALVAGIPIIRHGSAILSEMAGTKPGHDGKKPNMDALTKPKRKSLPATRRPPYPDLHDHIRALDAAGLLIRVDRPINKDTEMHPLVRWQFRGGIAERDRNAFLFTNVLDTKGRKYDIPVLVGGLASNREIYRIGLGCAFEEMDERWVRASQSPIPPRIR